VNPVTHGSNARPRPPPSPRPRPARLNPHKFVARGAYGWGRPAPPPPSATQPLLPPDSPGAAAFADGADGSGTLLVVEDRRASSIRAGGRAARAAQVAAAMVRASEDNALATAAAEARGGAPELALEPEDLAAAEAAAAEAAAGLRQTSGGSVAVVRTASLARASSLARSSFGQASFGRGGGGGAGGYGVVGLPRGPSLRASSAGGGDGGGGGTPTAAAGASPLALPATPLGPAAAATEVVLLEEDDIYPFGWGVVDAFALAAIGTLTGVSAWWLAARRGDRSNEFMQPSHAVALLLGPAGCYLRFFLSRFNGRVKGRWSWFPAGTFAANMGACVVNFTVRAYTQQLAGPVPNSIDDALSGLMTGFCGSLSTVSTWVVEVRPLREGQEGTANVAG
jgi:fluoride ion exporter CrcB/FEX